MINHFPNSLLLQVLLLLFGLFPSQVFSQGPTKATVKIGFILPLSGDWAFLGAGIRDAALLANADLQDRTFRYELLFEDNRGELKDSVTVAKRLINVEKVDALISIISGVGELLNPMAEQAQVLNVGICSNTSVAKGKFNFINYLTASQGVEKFVNEMKRRYPKNPSLAVFSLNEAGFNFIVEELKKQKTKHDISLASIETFEPKTTDFRSQILRSLSENPNALLILGLSPEIETLATQIRQLGKNVPLVSIEGFGLADNKEPFEGSWFVDAAVPNDSFRQRFMRTYGKDITAGVGHSYDTVLMIAEAFELASIAGKKPPRIRVAEEFGRLVGFSGVLGTVTVSSNGIVRTEPSIKVIHNGKAETAGQRDDRIRKSYENVEKGMSENQVLTVMQERPSLIKKAAWYYSLSQEANTRRERNWKLIVGFNDGVVVSKEVVYDHYTIVERSNH